MKTKLQLLIALSLSSLGLLKSQSLGSTALNFDGVDDNIRRGIVSTQSMQVTMEARVSWNGPSPSNRYIMYNGTNGTNGYGIFIPSGTSSVAVKYGGTTHTSTYTLPTGSLTLLSVVIVGFNGLQLYANGSLVWNVFPPPPPVPTGSFAIGSDDAGLSPFNGVIDEVRFWNRIVCAPEIAHRANCSAIGNEPQLVALYKFNQGIPAGNNPTVTVLMDSSPSNYTATLNNFALTTGTVSNWISFPGSYSTTCLFAPTTVTITPSGPVSVCPGNSATLMATTGGAASYTWSSGPTTASVVVTPTATSSYSVVANSSGCYSIGFKTVTVNSAPSVSVSSTNSVLCSGSTATLTASGAGTYSWSTGGTLTAIAVSPTTTTTYTVIGTGANSCTNMAVYTQSVSVCSGINEMGNYQFSIFPNPTRDLLTIKGDYTNYVSVQIIDNIGRIMLKMQMNPSYSKSIDVSALPAGIYFIELSGGYQKLFTGKIVKE